MSTSQSSCSENEEQFIVPVNWQTTENAHKQTDGLSSDGGPARPTSTWLTGDQLAGCVSSAIAVILILGLYFSHLIFVFLPWIASRTGEASTSGWLWAGLATMTLFAGLGFWSFLAAMCTTSRANARHAAAMMGDAVVENKDPLASDNEARSHASDGETRGPLVRRWCRKCRADKPPRAHHCSICNVCVLRMDHHCPWINNCVGLRNHGHYIRFLVFVTAAMLVGLVLMASRLISLRDAFLHVSSTHGRFSFAVTLETMQLVFLIADIVGCAVLSLIIGLLAAVQLANVAAGHTTIEGLELAQCERDAKHAIPFPYNLGTAENFKAVLGRRMLLWPLPLPLAWNPLANCFSDGTVFSVREDALLWGQWPLPSKDPLLLATPRSSGRASLSLHDAAILQNRANHARFRQGSADDGGGLIVPQIDRSKSAQPHARYK